MTGINAVLWFDKWAYHDDLTATFVNRNHFAIYAGMVMVCGTALTMQSWRKHIHGVRPAARLAALREWLQRKGMLRFFLLTVVLVCIALSHSRAGLVLTVSGLCGYVFFYQIYNRNYGRAAGIFFGGAILITIVFVLAGTLFERFDVLFADSSSRDRAHIYSILLHAIQDNPLLGYGLNGFQSIFRLYEQGMRMEFNRAHSDVLESLLDLGLPAGFALWSAMGLLVSGLCHGLITRRRNGMFPVLGLTVTIMILAHGMIDFSLQIPGVVFYWVTLMGIGLAQSWSDAKDSPVTRSL
jgi:O-antigen ligase